MFLEEYRFTHDWPYHISCGGIVYRSKASGIEILVLVGRNGSFDIPKGTLRYGETLEACALREVEEESGQKTEVTSYLGSKLAVGDIDGAEISKTTHYFALRWLSDTATHDEEYDHVEWTTSEDAKRRLKPSNAEIIDRLPLFLKKERPKPSPPV